MDKKKIGMVVVISAVLIGGGIFAYQTYQKHNQLPAGIAGVNGRLELERVDVASLYAGRVKSVLVNEGDNVNAGDVLVELSSDTVASKLRAAQAQKQQAQDAVVRAQAEITAQQQAQRVAKMELNNASNLRNDKLVSDAEVTRRSAQHDGATAAVAAAQAAQAQARATVNAAQAQIDEASSAYGDMNIRAPISGRVEYKIASAGNVIGAGSKVISLLDLTNVSMNIFLPAAQMNGVKIGSEARIKLDGIDAIWPAVVEFIASDAQFTPKSVETPNEREKLMFKIKLRVPVDVAKQYNQLLKGGMTGNGYVLTNANAQWPANWAIKLPQQ